VKNCVFHIKKVDPLNFQIDKKREFRIMAFSFEKNQNQKELLETTLQALEDILITGSVPPDLPVEITSTPQFQFLADYLLSLEQFSLAIAKGDLSPSLKLKGRMAGSLKELQASLRHLTWQTQMIAKGDFTQTTDFMGEFSTAFNSMVAKLEADRSELERRDVESTAQSNQMTTLFQIGMALTAGLELDHVMSEIYKQCQTVAPIDAFYIGLIDRENGSIEFPFLSMNGITRKGGKTGIDSNAGLASVIFSSRQAVNIEDLTQSEYANLFPAIHFGYNQQCSFLGVPLILRDEVIGVIAMLSLHPHAYSKDQIRLLQTMASQAAIAIENARLYEQVRHLAIVDELTEIYNYRGLMLLGTREVERAQRFNHPLTALFLDIDHFRNFNNRYSHNVGNQVLHSVAQECRSDCRSVDILSRYGGEEFVILLPETDLDAGAVTAERLVRRIETLRVATEKGSLGVTISIGVAELDNSVNNLQSLIEHANLGEHLAKTNGRNRAEKWKALK
jgi:diguanylate cyclase (GGDEF)-like protein